MHQKQSKPDKKPDWWTTDITNIYGNFKDVTQKEFKKALRYSAGIPVLEDRMREVAERAGFIVRPDDLSLIGGVRHYEDEEDRGRLNPDLRPDVSPGHPAAQKRGNHNKGGSVTAKRKPREFAKGGTYRGKPHAYAAGGRVTDTSASRKQARRKK
jgi:hypothetical protein